jgi:raffinose synthase
MLRNCTCLCSLQELAPGFRFAPIGLVDMFNSGGAVEGLTYHLLGGDGSTSTLGSEAVALACMEVKGCGRFGAYSSVRPRKCTLGSAQIEFKYDSSSGLVILQLDAMPKERVHKIVIEL